MLGYKSFRSLAYAYAGIFATVFIAFIVRLIKFDEFTSSQHINITLVSLIPITVGWESLRLINLWLNKSHPFEHNLSLRITLQLIIGAVVGLTIRFFIYLFGESQLPFKLDSLFIAATWVLYIMLPTAVNLIFFTIHFIDKWRESIVYSAKLEKEKSQVQFDNLKNQMNPHFLFNSLASLNSLIFENQQLASDFVQQLAKVYRYLLQHQDKNFVLLHTELDFISNYINLLHARFKGALKINVNITDKAKELAVVPVTLQILIENAIKHNIADPERPLTIDVLTIGDYLVVSNNLQLKKNVATSNKKGLDNLKSLYAFLTTKEVIIENTADRFFVKIPLI